MPNESIIESIHESLTLSINVPNPYLVLQAGRSKRRRAMAPLDVGESVSAKVVLAKPDAKFAVVEQEGRLFLLQVGGHGTAVEMIFAASLSTIIVQATMLHKLYFCGHPNNF